VTTIDEDRLRTALHRTLGDGPTVDDEWSDVARRGDAVAVRRRRRRVVLSSVMVVVLVLLAGGLAVQRRDEGSTQLQSGPGSSVAPVPTSPPTALPSSTPSTTPAGATVTTTTDLGTEQIAGIAAVPDGAWVANWGTGEVLHVDRAGRIVGRLKIGSPQQGPLAIASGEGSIWVLDFSTADVVRIDPVTTRETGRAHLAQEPEQLAVGNGKVWVTSCCSSGVPNQRLSRIDPRSLAIEQAVALPGTGETQQVGVNPAGVYVTGEQLAVVIHLDVSGTNVVGRAETGDQVDSARSPCLLAVGPTAVWCSVSSTGSVALIAAGDRTTLLPAPGAVSAVAVHRDQLVVSVPAGLFELGPDRQWRPIGGPPGLELSVDGDVLWEMSGTTLVSRPLP
jgi:streptogramin lyase